MMVFRRQQSYMSEIPVHIDDTIAHIRSAPQKGDLGGALAAANVQTVGDTKDFYNRLGSGMDLQQGSKYSEKQIHGSSCWVNWCKAVVQQFDVHLCTVMWNSIVEREFQ